MAKPKLRTIQTRPRKASVTRRQVAAAIKRVMAQRDEETIKLLTPPSERKRAATRK